MGVAQMYTDMANFEEKFGPNRYITKHYRSMARYWKDKK